MRAFIVLGVVVAGAGCARQPARSTRAPVAAAPRAAPPATPAAPIERTAPAAPAEPDEPVPPRAPELGFFLVDQLEASGALELAAVKKVMVGRSVGQSCFGRWKPASKDDVRRIAISFVVGPRGAILQIIATPPPSADEDACITGALRGAGFPAASGVTSVTWEIELRAYERRRFSDYPRP